jgi:hypothetical protein
MPRRENPRRIVTALREDGTSYIARVDELDRSGFHPRGDSPEELEMLAVAYPRWQEGELPDVRVVWGRNHLPFELPNDPQETPGGGIGGPDSVRFSITIYPPGWEGEYFWANRMNILWVLRGALTYRTDSGDEVVAEPGDTIVQNGTNNAFFNRGDEDVWMAAAMFTARRVAGPTPPRERFQGTQEQLSLFLAQAGEAGSATAG